MDWRGKFWKGVFSESDGTPSFSRVASAVVAAFALGWVSAIIVAHIRRDIRPEFPDFLGLIGFVSVFYTVNQVRAAFKPDK